MPASDINGQLRRALYTRYPLGDRNRFTSSRQRIFQFQQNLPLPPGNTLLQPAFQGNRRLPVAEITRQQVSRQRYFPAPPVSAVPPSYPGAQLYRRATDVTRQWAADQAVRKQVLRLKVFLPGLQQPGLPGNQTVQAALFVTRRLGSQYVRRLVQRQKAFHQAFAAPVPPFSPGNSVSGPAFEANRRAAAAYHRELRDRTRVFQSGGGILVGTAPFLSGTGTVTASATLQVNAAVAFSGTGSMDVFITAYVPKYTALSYIPPNPANSTLVLAGFDLGAQSECQLGTDGNVPAGTTNFGFVDTTYTVSKAQILATVSGTLVL